MLIHSLLVASLCSFGCAAHAAGGKSAHSNHSTKTKLNPVVVTATAPAPLTVPDNAQAKENIQRTPGGVAVVPAEQYKDKYTVSLEDTLSLTPGVYAQKRFGEEVRLSIRGSGLSRGFHLRGLTLLQDGIPFTLADGASDFQEADSLATQRIEVYKGGNGLQYGGTTLGGAVNMVTKTGHSDPGNQIRTEIGSDDTYRVNMQSGQVFEESDMFVSLTGTTSDGYRRHEDQENIKLNSNVGVNINDSTETRFYLSGNVIEQELPGSVSKRGALTDPRAADPSAISTDWHRDIRSVRLANKTTFEVGDDDSIDVGAFVNVKDLFHPITPFAGVIDQESVDYGVFAQGAGEYRLGDYRNRYRVGLTSQFGEMDAEVFRNVAGSRGALTTDTDQDARNAILYGENHFFVHPEWALVTGGQLIWSEREVEDHLNPLESDSKTYTNISPKLGVLYEPSAHIQFFSNVSRSYEVPTFSELTQAGTAGFTPVDAQKAWTAEIGGRGNFGPYAWDVSLYRAWLDDEMLQYTTGPSIPASTFNADDTIHQGLELGFDVRLGQNLLSTGDHLQWRNAYTFSDFNFENDRQFRNNGIAGQPAHFYQTELRYDHGDGWYIAPNLEMASDADVDFANTLKAPGYALLGLGAGVDVTESVSLFFDARNLLDQEHISTFSTLVNNSGNTNVYFPGDGRRLFAGMTVRF